MLKLGKNYGLGFKLVKVKDGKRWSMFVDIDADEWLIRYRIWRETKPKNPSTPLFFFGSFVSAAEEMFFMWPVEKFLKTNKENKTRGELWLCLAKNPRKLEVVSEYIDSYSLELFWKKGKYAIDVQDADYYAADSLILLLPLATGKLNPLRYWVKLQRFFGVLSRRVKNVLSSL